MKKNLKIEITIAVLLVVAALVIACLTVRAQTPAPEIVDIYGTIDSWSKGLMALHTPDGSTYLLQSGFAEANTEPAIHQTAHVSFDNTTKTVAWARFETYPFVRQAFDVYDGAWPSFESARRALRVQLANDGWHSCYIDTTNTGSKKIYCERER